jgi:hypothetical protein
LNQNSLACVFDQSLITQGLLSASPFHIHERTAWHPIQQIVGVVAWRYFVSMVQKELESRA